MSKTARAQLMEICSAIESYAEAYTRLENIQADAKGLMPFGDQKTGVIAEFYCRLYARKIYPKAEHMYGTTSERGWDITINNRTGRKIRIQVKAVSVHSKTSRISPIHKGWDQLWLVRLDERFRPIGFWTLDSKNVAWARETKLNQTMPRPGQIKFGSAAFAYALERTEDFLGVINSILR